MLTNTRRLVLVGVKGLVMKEYRIVYAFDLADIIGARIEKTLLGRALVIVARVHDERAQVMLRHEGVKDPEVWVDLINQEIRVDETRESTSRDLATLLNSKQRTSVSEILPILQISYPKADESSSVGWVKYLISENMVQGFFDEAKNEFVRASAGERENEVHQQIIASSFDLSPDGILQITCPHCGSSQELRKKEQTILCVSCQRIYAIPEKLLHML